jgi:integrase
MASIRRQSSGRWRAQVRLKGVTISDTFARRQDAHDWAIDREREIDRGETPKTRRTEDLRTFGDLVDLHIEDMREVGKAPRRSKEATLLALKRHLGAVSINDLDRERIVEFGRERMRQGAGPTTIGIDVGFIKLVVQHAAAVHGIPVRAEPIDFGRIALKRLGLVGHSRERDRRPTEGEIKRLIAHFEGNPRQLIPMGQIIRFAIATAMRQEEICRVAWSDLDTRTRMLTIRDRKDPRAKKGNDQRIPLLAVSGYDALALVEAQRACRANDDDRIFPVNHKSVSNVFTRACQHLKIEDLHFHDLRHESASRLFEAGFTIEQVALVTGHKDWKMLMRMVRIGVQHEDVVEALPEGLGREGPGRVAKRQGVSLRRHREHDRQADGRVGAAPAVQQRRGAPFVGQVADVRPAQQPVAERVFGFQLAVAGDVVEVGPDMAGIPRPPGDLDHHLGRPRGQSGQLGSGLDRRRLRAALEDRLGTAPARSDRWAPGVLEPGDRAQVLHRSVDQ